MKAVPYLIFYCIMSEVRIMFANGQQTNLTLRKAMIPHIVNGYQVPVKLFPHTAILHMATIPYCGGSIITHRTILTAAHCIVGFNNNNIPALLMSVQVGSNYSKMYTGEVYRVCSSFKHPLYNSSYHAYDIALLVLKKSIQFSEFINKISIAKSFRWRNPSAHFHVAGYGVTLDNNQMSEDLQATRMRFVPTPLCMEAQHAALNPEDIMDVPKSMFCMIGDENNSDCNGDSGTAVVWGKYQVGMVATGIEVGCGSSSMPSMYTDCVYFRKFIYTNAARLESENPVNECSGSLFKKRKFRHVFHGKKRPRRYPKKRKHKKRKFHYNVLRQLINYISYPRM